MREKLIDIIKESPEFAEIGFKALSMLSYAQLRTLLPASMYQEVRENQLIHRIAVIQDDIMELRNYVHSSSLYGHFNKEINGVSGWSHINNIEIACDLSSDESLEWRLYKTEP